MQKASYYWLGHTWTETTSLLQTLSFLENAGANFFLFSAAEAKCMVKGKIQIQEN